MADDLRCAMCGGAGSETTVYTGEKIQVYTAVDREGGEIAGSTPTEIALHPRCTHDWLAEHQDQALAAGPGAW